MRTYTFRRVPCGHTVRGSNKRVCEYPCIVCYSDRIKTAHNQTDIENISSEYNRVYLEVLRKNRGSKQ